MVHGITTGARYRRTAGYEGKIQEVGVCGTHTKQGYDARHDRVGKHDLAERGPLLCVAVLQRRSPCGVGGRTEPATNGRGVSRRMRRWSGGAGLRLYARVGVTPSENTHVL